VSKKHGAKQKRRKKAAKHAVLCASCRQPLDDPWSLLAAIAAAFNACADAGVWLKLRHGVVMTGRGYVLPLAGGRWGAGTQDFTTFPEIAAAAALDDD
jgi:hypothetical protein